MNLFRAATVVELSAEMRNEDAADPPARSPAIAPIPREIQRIQRSADDELVLQGEMT